MRCPVARLTNNQAPALLQHFSQQHRHHHHHSCTQISSSTLPFIQTILLQRTSSHCCMQVLASLHQPQFVLESKPNNLTTLILHSRLIRQSLGVGSSGAMRPVAFLLVLVALMASVAGGDATHGRIGIHSAVDGRWPDLVGRDAEEAKTHILTERPNLVVHIVPENSMMTMDYNINRVRLFVNRERKVVKCPTIG